MKVLSLSTVFLLSILLLTVGFSEANNSASIAVSCSIPRVPGLNAPLNDDENSKTDKATRENVKSEETRTEIAFSAKIEEKSEKEILLSSGENSSLETVTVYSR